MWQLVRSDDDGPAFIQQMQEFAQITVCLVIYIVHKFLVHFYFCNIYLNIKGRNKHTLPDGTVIDGLVDPKDQYELEENIMTDMMVQPSSSRCRNLPR